MKSVLGFVILFALCSTPSLAGDDDPDPTGNPIQGIADAGLMGCVSGMPESVNERFVKFVEEKCIGNVQCNFQARTAGPKWGCKSFFVKYKCGSKTRKFFSDNIEDAVVLNCE